MTLKLKKGGSNLDWTLKSCHLVGKGERTKMGECITSIMPVSDQKKSSVVRLTSAISVQTCLSTAADFAIYS